MSPHVLPPYGLRRASLRWSQGYGPLPDPQSSPKGTPCTPVAGTTSRRSSGARHLRTPHHREGRDGFRVATRSCARIVLEAPVPQPQGGLLLHRGNGSVVEPDGTVHEITPGVIYVLPDHEAARPARRAPRTMHLISVFNPAIARDEKHDPVGGRLLQLLSPGTVTGASTTSPPRRRRRRRPVVGWRGAQPVRPRAHRAPQHPPGAGADRDRGGSSTPWASSPWPRTRPT